MPPELGQAEFFVRIGTPSFDFLEARVGTMVTLDARKGDRKVSVTGILRRATLPDENNAIHYWVE